MVSNAFGVPKDVTGDPYSGITLYKSIQAIITSAFILGPLSLGRDMGSFKNLAILSLSCLIYTILIVVIELPFYDTLYD